MREGSTPPWSTYLTQLRNASDVPTQSSGYVGLDLQRSFASNALPGVGRDARFVTSALAAQLLGRSPAPGSGGLCGLSRLGPRSHRAIAHRVHHQFIDTTLAQALTETVD